MPQTTTESIFDPLTDKDIKEWEYYIDLAQNNPSEHQMRITVFHEQINVLGISPN